MERMPWHQLKALSGNYQHLSENQWYCNAIKYVIVLKRMRVSVLAFLASGMDIPPPATGSSSEAPPLAGFLLSWLTANTRIFRKRTQNDEESLDNNLIRNNVTSEKDPCIFELLAKLVLRVDFARGTQFTESITLQMLLEMMTIPKPHFIRDHQSFFRKAGLTSSSSMHKRSCFWKFSVVLELYDSCPGMINLRFLTLEDDGSASNRNKDSFSCLIERGVLSIETKGIHGAVVEISNSHGATEDIIRNSASKTMLVCSNKEVNAVVGTSSETTTISKQDDNGRISLNPLEQLEKLAILPVFLQMNLLMMTM
ncbi:hypothetical protein VNO77_27257 [Canavalia gladiata]|uniref:Uncharacterized protein n=1 Tax=Canavalia gladiata TaxID=3824 RepID=A0AAN9Q6B5_CANGL